MKTITMIETFEVRPKHDFPSLLTSLEMELHNRGELTALEIKELMTAWLSLDLLDAVMKMDASQSDYNFDKIATRMASLLSLWSSCEDIELTQSDLSELITFKEAFATVFLCSGFRGFAHLKSYLAVRQPNGTFSIPQNKLIIYFLLVPIDELDNNYFELAQKLPKDIYVILMLGWLNSRYVMSPFGEQVRQKLFLQSDILAKVNANHSFIIYLFNAWMHCAYAEGNNRLQLKKNINQMIVNFLNQNGYVQSKLSERPKRNKPLLLVVHERISKGHAMYRCWVPYFRHLANYFELVSLAEEDLPEELLGNIFGRHLKITDAINLESIVSMIEKVKPDLIYYPSLGMKKWTGFLCNMRLAPMQLMSGGHPDSSQSKVIDYFFIGPPMPFIRGECSEKVICAKTYVFKTVPNDELKGYELSILPPSDGKIHIAVNCTPMKLSASFMKCLEELQVEFGEKVQFHFFHAAERGLALQLNVVIKSRLKTAKVYSGQTYGDFLKLLRQCHFSMSPFPFGNANSVFDAIMLGLPVVAIKGHRLAGYTDYLVLKEFDLDQLGMVENRDQYIQTARKLITDQDYYQNYRSAINDAVQRFNSMEYDDYFDSNFADAVYATYLIHHTNSKKRLYCWNGEKLEMS